MFDLKTKVLIVDDMTTMRKIVVKVCREIGFTEITEAADGNKAMEAIVNAATPFGLIISDWNMPNCTGLELLKKVRATENLKTIPFVLVTAEAEQAQIVEALKAGVSSYVVKPFSGKSLKDKLEAVHQKMSGGTK